MPQMLLVAQHTLLVCMGVCGEVPDAFKLDSLSHPNIIVRVFFAIYAKDSMRPRLLYVRLRGSSKPSPGGGGRSWEDFGITLAYLV